MKFHDWYCASDAKVKRTYMSRTPVFSQKPCRSRWVGHCYSDRLSKSYSVTKLACLVVLAVWDKCQLAGWAVCDETKFPANFISRKLCGLSQFRSPCVSIVVAHLMQGVCMVLSCLPADTSFAPELWQHCEIRTTRLECIWSIQWRAGRGVHLQ